MDLVAPELQIAKDASKSPHRQPGDLPLNSVDLAPAFINEVVIALHNLLQLLVLHHLS
jgi:hypothetical protein